MNLAGHDIMRQTRFDIEGQMNIGGMSLLLVCSLFLLSMLACGGANRDTPDSLVSLEISNAYKWFGGEDRDEAHKYAGPPSRNVGTGQSIVLTNSIILESFSVHFSDKFDFSLNLGTKYEAGHQVDLILDIRNDTGQIIATAKITVPSSFDGGWVEFSFTDQDIILLSDTEYIFTWFLEDGESIDFSTASSGNNRDPYKAGTGYTAEIIPGESLKEWDEWEKHVWDFLFRVEGQFL